MKSPNFKLPNFKSPKLSLALGLSVLTCSFAVPALASGSAEVQPANACQAKALAAARAEVRSTLGINDAQFLGLRQTNWVVTFSVHSEAATNNLNPAGQIDILVGTKNLTTTGDCETTGVSLDVYDVRG